MKWKDYEEYYLEWAKIIDFENIVLIGGEPFLNPDLDKWCKNIKKLWPNAKNLIINTNGTLIKKNKDNAKNKILNGWSLDISCHDPNDYENIKQTVENILYEIKFLYDIILEDDPTGPVLNFVSNNKIVAQLRTNYFFFPNYVKKFENKTFYFHKTDPVETHNNCKIKDCYFMINGLFYKCPLVAIGSQAIQQFTFEERAKKLLQSYKACSPFDSEEKIKKFFLQLDNPIPQCTLCDYSKDRFKLNVKLNPLPKKKLKAR